MTSVAIATIIRPITVTSEMLISSNVPEDDHPEYNASTSYSAGTRCMIAALHRVYEAQVSNSGKYPPDYLANGDLKANPAIPHTWREVGATNKWKMFDKKSRAATTHPDNIVIKIKPDSLVNSIALLNTECHAISIVVTDTMDGEVYSHDADMVDKSAVVDPYTWCFELIIRKHDVVRLDLPAYIGAEIDIILTDPDNPVQLGECVLGAKKELGTTQYGYSGSFEDYSTKEKDEDGNVFIDEGEYSDTLSLPIKIPTSRVFDIKQTLAKYRATPLVFVGTTQNLETIVYGLRESFNVTVPGPHYSDCNLDIEELI